jgi:hypothetical protein
MKPVDFRTESWERVQERLNEHRLAVHALYVRFGPCTTRELSERSTMSILSLRPRTTELLQLGLVALVGRKDCQGVYAPISLQDAERAFQEKVRAFRQPAQLDLFS